MVYVRGYILFCFLLCISWQLQAKIKRDHLDEPLSKGGRVSEQTASHYNHQSTNHERKESGKGAEEDNRQNREFPSSSTKPHLSANRDKESNPQTPKCVVIDSPPSPIIVKKNKNQAEKIYEDIYYNAIRYYLLDDVLSSSFCVSSAMDMYLTNMDIIHDESIHEIYINIHAILSAISKFGASSVNADKQLLSSMTKNHIRYWEMLGPFPVSKLEIDGDPAFSKYEKIKSVQDNDPIGHYILRSPSNQTFYSELVPSGELTWQPIIPDAQENLNVQFLSVDWQSLGQGLGTSAAFEFQGWMRGMAYAYSAGMYSVNCRGTHTVYIRNDNFTRILIGDVYHLGVVQGILSLKVGPIAIVFPIRGAGRTNIHCSINRETIPFQAFAPRYVPSLVEISTKHGGKSKHGLLLSNTFSIDVLNRHKQTVSLDVTLESKEKAGRFDIQVIDSHSYKGLLNDKVLERIHVSIPSGQLHSIPLQLVYLRKESDAEAEEDSSLPLLPCNKKGYFWIHIRSSEGHAMKIPLDFTCRRLDQSILVSYLDHDGSVNQAAVVFPLPGSSGRLVRDPTVLESQRFNRNHSMEYPYLLTLHGTGVSPSSQADSYKTLKDGSKVGNYQFGVKGFVLIAASRFGAHNWESIGESSAHTSVEAIRYILRQYSFLPQLSDDGIYAGHSMGSHGAWLAAVNDPSKASCLMSIASWIRKEDYNSANAFFMLDTQNSHMEPDLKIIFEKSMSEYHSDKLLSNLKYMDVYIRVGGADMTTHPFYSRRMYRLLREYHNVSVTYHEYLGQQHWWWDSFHSNDGGVVNDDLAREFFQLCRLKLDRISQYDQNRSHDTGISTHRQHDRQDRASPMRDLSVRFHETICDEFTLSVINPASQRGLCGIRILQQHQAMTMSNIQTHRDEMSMKDLIHRLKSEINDTDKEHKQQKNLEDIQSLADDARQYNGNELRSIHFIETKNVRRFRIRRSQISKYSIANMLIINNYPQLIADDSASCHGDHRKETCSVIRNDSDVIDQDVEICVDETDHSPHTCDDVKSSNTIPEGIIEPGSSFEKSPAAYGPIRQVYSKPLYIVYGTPAANQQMRLMMKDYAIYLANSIYASHHSTVYVRSDSEYWSMIILHINKYKHPCNHPQSKDRTSDGSHDQSMDDDMIDLNLQGISDNVMFIGGPTINKAFKRLCEFGEKELDHMFIAITCRTEVEYSNQKEEKSNKQQDQEEKLHSNNHFNNDRAFFKLGNHIYENESVIYAFPVIYTIRPKCDGPNRNKHHQQTSMAVSIHANTVSGWLHISRMSWPVVPPMVRAPFANYLPDFIVFSSSIWYKGFGSVRSAGFWDMEWKYDRKQAYTA